LWLGNERSPANRREHADLSVTDARIIHASDKNQPLQDPFVQICPSHSDPFHKEAYAQFACRLLHRANNKKARLTEAEPPRLQRSIEDCL
jgi:hypothetical protein